MPPPVAPEKYELVREIVKVELDLTVQEVAWEFHRAHRPQREPSRDGADPAEARADAKKKTLKASEQAEPRS